MNEEAMEMITHLVQWVLEHWIHVLLSLNSPM